MKKNVLYIDIVYRDKGTKEIIKVLVSHNGKQDEITLRKLSSLIKMGYKIENAILTCNNVLRAKSGHLKTEYIDEKLVGGLLQYKNSKKYDGNTDKFGITMNNIDYIVKYPKEKGDTSIFSEYVASNFIRGLGYNGHETFLAKDEGNIVVLLKDFTNLGEYLRSYKDTNQSSEDTLITNKYYTYDDVLYMIKKHTKLSDEQKKNCLIQFWQMYMCDAILANRDRHHGNWGYIRGKSGYRIAPIYDNGSSLYPDVSKKLDLYKSNRKKFLEERSEKFPASLLCIYDDNLKRNRRTNYYEMVGILDNIEKNLVYNHIKSIGIENIYNIIKKCCSNRLIPKDLSNFYIDIVCIRYMHIILRMSFEDSYRRLLDVRKSN